MTLSVQPQTHGENSELDERGDAGLLVGLTDDPALIKAARQLTAERYVAEGYVTADDLDAEGLLNPSLDPYAEHSTYFVAVDQSVEPRVVATIRQIDFNPEKDWDSFPMLAYFDLWPSFSAQLQESEPEHWVELSALAKEPGVPDEIVNRLYREMWGRSFRRNHDHWLIAADRRLARRLRSIFRDAIAEAGPPSDYLGSDTLPLFMPTTHCLDSVCDRYFEAKSERVKTRCFETASYFLRGMDHTGFDAAQIARFREMGIELVFDLTGGTTTARSG